MFANYGKKLPSIMEKFNHEIRRQKGVDTGTREGII